MSIARTAIVGAAFASSTGIVTRAIGLVGTLLLVRYLLPSEYGEVSAASIVVLTANQFSTLGAGMFVLANPRAGRDVVFHATLWHVAVGVLALCGVLAFRRELGPLFDAPGMARFLPGLVLAGLLDRLSFMPERILLRDLHFRGVSLARTCGELAYTCVSVATAMAGLGGMSVVYGSICRSAAKLAYFGTAASRREWLELHPLRGNVFRRLIGYGTAVALGGIAGFGSRRWDNLLISRQFGTAVMGQYNVAYNLADLPAVQVGEQITDVLLSSFSHVDPPKRPAALVRTCTLLALVVFPLAFGLGATAPSVVAAFFDRRWVDVAPMLMLLSILSVSRPIAGAMTAYLHSMNRPQAVAWLEWASLAVLLGGIATLGSLGPLWSCVAVGVAFNLKALATMWLVRRYDAIPMRRFLSGLVAPLLACLPMIAVVVLARHALRAFGWGRPGLSLLVEVTVGAVTYAGVAWLVAGEASRDLIRVVRSVIDRSRSAPEATRG